MAIYETIKTAIPLRQAAVQYGLNVSRNGMTCCPFHEDRHPSLKLNDDYFFCFGCGVKGDVIDLTARLFGLSNYAAAQKLATDFGIKIEPGLTMTEAHTPRYPHIRQFREDEILCFRVLTDYLHLLEDWKVRYQPKGINDPYDERYLEACQMLDRIEYMADVLTVGDLEDRVAIVDQMIKDDQIVKLQEYTARKKGEEKLNGE